MTFDAGVSTANTLLLQLGDFIYLELSSQSGVQVSGSTAVTWGDFVSGTAWYYWQEDGAQSQITGNYCLNTGTKSQVIFSSDKINCTIVSGGSTSNYPIINPSLNDIYFGCGSGNVISVTGITPYSYEGGIGIKGYASPVYSPSSATLNYNSTFVQSSVAGTNVRNISNYYPSSPYVPALRGDLSYNDVVPIVLEWVNDNLDEGEPELTSDDVLTWEDIAPTEEPTEPPTEPPTDLDGNIIINNYDSATINFENDIDVNGTVNVDVQAGAFGAGAFGAGAIGFANADIDINGEVSGSLDINVDTIDFNGDFSTNGNFDVNGDYILNGNATYNNTLTVENGGTLENHYHYQIDGSDIQFPSYPAIDYDEILSEQEFYNILSTETYSIEPLETGLYSLELQTVPPMEALPEQLTLVSGAVISEGADLLNDFGLSSVYTPLAIFTIICFILKGGR